LFSNDLDIQQHLKTWPNDRYIIIIFLLTLYKVMVNWCSR